MAFPRTPATSPTSQRTSPSLSQPLHDLKSRLRGYERLRHDRLHGNVRGGEAGRSGTQTNAAMTSGKTVKEWETLVLFAVNLARLDVMVNMSNIMGQCV